MTFKKSNKRRIFLDYASTTPLDLKVRRVMEPYFTNNFGNPSSLYDEGMSAKRAVGDARSTIAKILHARSEEIIFTGSGTEADNLALLGVYNYFRTHIQKPHIITTTIEHPAILETCRYIESVGGEVTYVGVSENGIVSSRKIKEAIKENTVLVSVMYANNEIGTIEPIREIAKMIHAHKKESRKTFPYFHTDAAQAANYLDLNIEIMRVDLMTLDGSKIYGPKGVGVLYAKKGLELRPYIHGGGQERGLRSGTENVPAIVGIASALSLTQEMREKESARLVKLRDFFIAELEKIPGLTVNGDKNARLPNNINICVRGLDAEFAVIQLNEKGIACSSVSACKNLSENSASYVIEALGEKGKECSTSSLRLTLGRYTTKSDVEYALKIIKKIVNT